MVLARSQTKILNSPEELLPQQYFSMILRRYSRLQPLDGMDISPAVWVDIDDQLRKLARLTSPNKIAKLTKKNMISEIEEITMSLRGPFEYLRNRLEEPTLRRKLSRRFKVGDLQFGEIDTE